MWFRFPAGCGELAIQGQNFVAEIVEDGWGFFQAPAHFADEILGLNMGFAVLEPVDVKGITPYELVAKNEESIKVLSQRIGVLEGENSSLHMENDNLRAEIAELSTLRSELELKIKELDTEIDNLKFDLEQAGVKADASD